MEGKATKLLRGTLAVVLASCLCLPTPALAANGVEEGHGADGVGDGRTDVTESWALGDARIEAGGTYVLSGDVSAESPLVVALPEGENAMIDLAGHGVTVGGDATCAVDLSENRGSVAFVDSTRDADAADGVEDAGDAGEGRPRASIILKADDSSEDASLITCVRTSPANEAAPSASFEGLRLSIEASEKTVESYERAVAIARTGIAPGDDGRWKADDETVSLSFRDCNLATEVQLPDDERVVELIEATGAAQGAVSVIDAGCRGVELGGRIAASVGVDGEAPDASSSAMFLSAFDSSYVIDDDIEVVAFSDDAESLVSDEGADGEGAERGSDGEADDGEPDGTASDGEDDAPTLVFGYPAELSADDSADSADSNEAIVAVPAPDGKIPEQAVEFLAAAEGFEAEFDRADGDADGFSAMRLVEADGDAGGAGDADDQAAQGVTEADGGEDAQARPEADEPESDEAPEPADDVATVEADGDAGAVAVADAESDVREDPAAGVPAASVEPAVEVAADAPAAESGDSQPAAGTYAHYVAEHSGELVYAADIAATNGTDLNAAWKKQEGGLSKSYTITSGGTYYMSADLKASGSLAINAPGKNVTLTLNGHTLALACTGLSESSTMLSIAAAKSVSIDGSAKSGVSTIKNSSATAVWGIASSDEDCSVAIKDTHIELAPTNTAQRPMDAHAIRIRGGTLAMERCVVSMDFSNQTLRNSNYAKTANSVPPSAVYIAAKTASATLTNCTVTAIGTPCFSLSDVNDKASIGNAYALYARAATTVKGGSYTAVSEQGNATCIYGNKLTVALGSSIALKADAGQIASGLMTDVEGGIALNAPFTFGVDDGYADVADAEAALRTRVANGFKFGNCAPSGSTSYSALAMMEGDSLAAANANGYVLGSFAATLGSTQRDSIIGSLGNALGEGCFLVANGGKIQFSFDSSTATGAVACVDDTTYYPSLASALKSTAFTEGSTLKLLRDVDAVNVAATKSGVLDLNGHTIGSLKFSAGSGGAGLTVRNGLIDGTQAANGALASVYQTSASPLVLSGVTVRARGVDKTTYGVYSSSSAGSLSLTGGSSLDVTATWSSSASGCSAYGVFMQGTSQAAITGGSAVSVRTASAGVGVYGVWSAGDVEVTGSSVKASGTTSVTGAVYTTRSVSVVNSDIDAFVTGASPSSYGFGVCCYASQSTAKALVQSSSVSMRSAIDVSGRPYSCLLGSPYQSASSTATWTLSGENTLLSPDGCLDMGYNVGAIVLDADFGLSAESDGKLALSQTRQSGHVGMAVNGSPSSTVLNRLANCFSPSSGSYYEGWILVADEAHNQLVWRQEGDASGAGTIELQHEGSAARFPSLDLALASAQSGDVVKLLADVAESGDFGIAQDNLTIDLAGHTLVVRAGSGASAGDANAGGALRYSGAGVLSVEGSGRLEVQVGIASEPTNASSITYQGFAVSGGGTLSVGVGTVVSVSYVGSTAPAVSQRDIGVRGVAISNGKLVCDGDIHVTGSAVDGGLGAMAVSGVLVCPRESSDAAEADIASSSSVSVQNGTAATSTIGSYYSESGSSSGTMSKAPSGLREITVDSSVDPDFYDALVEKFRETATFDNPNGTASGNTQSLKLGIYHSMGMMLSAQANADGSIPWYNGLYVWAFTDEVPSDEVGASKAIVPTHVFVGSAFDQVPEARGVASETAGGKASVHVSGDVSASCAYGDAITLDAGGADGVGVEWTCEGAALSAQSDDDAVHLIAQQGVDLRDHLTFSEAKSSKIAYSALSTASDVAFAPTVARCARIAEGVAFTFDGSEKFLAEGMDDAAVELDGDSAFTVGDGFALASASEACSVATGAGENVQGALFAKGAEVNPSLFEDSYGLLSPGAVDGGVGWSNASDAVVVEFKVGSAVVKRYVSPEGDINLAEPSLRAARADDNRQSYELKGWSLIADEHATSGYVDAGGSIAPTESAVYYAVYSTGLTTDSVVFTNIHDGTTGELVPDVTVPATYGQTVGNALAAAGVTVPESGNYTSDGLEYRFIGWYPYASSSPTDMPVYDADKVGDLAVTLEERGVSSGALTLRAVYLALDQGQHVIRFIVDGCTNACAVDDGARPAYIMANSGNVSYIVPEKIDSEVGKTFSFESWFVDADNDGVLGETETSYTGTLPRAFADATYVADWSSSWADVTLTFHYKLYDAKSGAYTANATKSVVTTYESASQDVADSVIEGNRTIAYGGKLYEFLGWSPRDTDLEAVYDDSNPLPSVVGDDRAMSSDYAKTYYAVYSTRDHRVNVVFYDGAVELGSVNGVLTASTSVDAAFEATGAATPANKSATNTFRGWATRSTASKALDGSSTMISSLVTASTKTLHLYAVFGSSVSYRVRLRDEDGSRIWYSVKVREGKTVASVFESLNKPITSGSTFSKVPAKKNKYFSGWYTAAKKFYGLKAKVVGTVNAYAKYKDLTVSTPDASEITADAKPGDDLMALGVVKELESITLSFVGATSGYAQINTQISLDDYKLLNAYNMSYLAKYVDGSTVIQDGDIGAIKAKVKVGSSYAGSKVGVYWLAKKGAVNVVKSSLGKVVDSSGYITVSLDNFKAVDVASGGNLVLARKEAASGKDSTGEAGKKSVADSYMDWDSKNKIWNGSQNRRLGGATDASSNNKNDDRSAAAGAVAGDSNGTGLSSGLGGVSGGLSLGGSSIGMGGLGALSDAAPLMDNALNAESSEDGQEAEEESFFSDWDSNAIVLLALVLAALASMLYGLWRLVVVRQRRNEAEAEIPDISEKYAKGLTF